MKTLTAVLLLSLMGTANAFESAKTMEQVANINNPQALLDMGLEARIKDSASKGKHSLLVNTDGVRPSRVQETIKELRAAGYVVEEGLNLKVSW